MSYFGAMSNYAIWTVEMLGARIIEWRERLQHAKTKEQHSWRVLRDDERDALIAEVERLRGACRHVVANCFCQPSGQTCDVCSPAALALAERPSRGHSGGRPS